MSDSFVARPLVGEPLALDLVNTQWNENGERQDLLEREGGVAQWLDEHSLAMPPQSKAVRAALQEVRAVLRRCLASDDTDQEAVGALNAILAKGRVVLALNKQCPDERVEIAEADRAAWLAAQNYLRLRAEWGYKRIRACAHPDCILYFLDQTRNGTRRWCDMRTCGNRAKAKRFSQRRRKE